MSEYPVICACATASFAVLSDTITTIQSIVRPQKRNAAQLIAKLQAQERDKLNVTAALHLERIRFESSTNATDDSVRYLLQEGVQSLRAKATTCIEQINEILEEIRMEVVDDNDN
jgi:predicted DNA-binding ribbon-helix-helix protein